jgi:hypothetical protein
MAVAAEAAAVAALRQSAAEVSEQLSASAARCEELRAAAAAAADVWVSTQAELRRMGAALEAAGAEAAELQLQILIANAELQRRAAEHSESLVAFREQLAAAEGCSAKLEAALRSREKALEVCVLGGMPVRCFCVFGERVDELLTD